MKKTFYISVLFLLMATLTRAYPPKSSAPIFVGIKKYGCTFGASSPISFFKVDTRISERAIPRLGGGGYFKLEFYPSQSVHIQFGIEIMSQAAAFNSYYFVPGYSVLYDKSYGYTHTLRTVEMYVPLLVRIGLKPEEGNEKNILYFVGGYAPKVFLAAKTNIIQNSTGNGVGGGNTELLFEHHYLGPQVGNVFIAGFGYDKRLGFVEKYINFEVNFRYNLSRFTYDLGRYEGNLLYIKNYCISFQVGYRFR